MGSAPKKVKLENDAGMELDSANSVQVSERSVINAEDIFKMDPHLAFKLLIRNSEDVQLSKTCRLVCKALNDEACHVLHKRTVVLLEEDKPEKLQEFKDLVVSGSIRPLGQQPLKNPFLNFRALATTFTNRIFVNFITFSSIHVTELKIIVAENRPFDENSFENFWRVKGGDLKTLEFKYDDNDDGDSCSILLKKDCMSFNMEDMCSSLRCSHITLMGTIISGLELESIRLDVKDGQILQSLREENLVHLKRLDLTIEEISDQSWTFLGNYRMPQLEKLSIDFTDFEDVVNHSQQMDSLLQNVASTVAELNLDMFKIERLPDFPKLCIIVVWGWEDSFGLFSPIKFPSLQRIVLHMSNTIEKILGNSFLPHEGVTKVTLVVREPDDLQINDSISSNLFIVLDQLKRQFPRVVKLGLDVGPVDLSTFVALCGSFPDLKELGLEGNSNFLALSGISDTVIKTYLRLMWPLENICRYPSIFSLPKLEHLLLGPKIGVTDDIVRHCLSRISSLKALTFCWNPELSVSAVQNYLGHLEETRIENGAEEGFLGVMSQLKDSLPNVKSGLSKSDAEFAILYW